MSSSSLPNLKEKKVQTVKLSSTIQNRQSKKRTSKTPYTPKQLKKESIGGMLCNANLPTNPKENVKRKHIQQIRNKIIPPPPSIPLNKHIAHCGICSRRAAVDIIRKGMVSVNGAVVIEPATRILPKDKVLYKQCHVMPTKKLVYIVLNKPKDYICTHQDKKNRKTVYQLLQSHNDMRLHSVGRLDRNTTGVLLFTNDGNFTQRLAHPSFEVQKIYHVILDKNLDAESITSLRQGVLLEDGIAQADEVAYTNTQDKKQVGLSLHSGKNRIVRRMFEKLGYKVTALDRVLFGNISKKNLPRGKYRLLKESEVRHLKLFLPKQRLKVT